MDGSMRRAAPQPLIDAKQGEHLTACRLHSCRYKDSEWHATVIILCGAVVVQIDYDLLWTIVVGTVCN